MKTTICPKCRISISTGDHSKGKGYEILSYEILSLERIREICYIKCGFCDVQIKFSDLENNYKEKMPYIHLYKVGKIVCDQCTHSLFPEMQILLSKAQDKRTHNGILLFFPIRTSAVVLLTDTRIANTVNLCKVVLAKIVRKNTEITNWGRYLDNRHLRRQDKISNINKRIFRFIPPTWGKAKTIRLLNCHCRRWRLSVNLNNFYCPRYAAISFRYAITTRLDWKGSANPDHSLERKACLRYLVRQFQWQGGL